MNITINNVIGLLEELVTNGDAGSLSLIAWYDAERDDIINNLEDIKGYEEDVLS